MNFFLESIQSAVNLLFLFVVLGTLIISWIYAYRLKKLHNADFPWGKALMIVGIEVAAWIGFTIFFELFQKYWIIITIVGLIAIYIISTRKKKKYV
ncbi:hypothetical protein C6497_14110 [Candidatus Poribacteria bacterium]|nr:MAG: hypothetical protein C6497_14110 [Candidatus Poribacteria bacterium]